MKMVRKEMGYKVVGWFNPYPANVENMVSS